MNARKQRRESFARNRTVPGEIGPAVPALNGFRPGAKFLLHAADSSRKAAKSQRVN